MARRVDVMAGGEKVIASERSERSNPLFGKEEIASSHAVLLAMTQQKIG